MHDTFRVLVNEHWLTMPARCRRVPGVDGANRRGVYFEPYVMLAIEALAGPGQTVYDVGCSYGVFSCILAQIVGPEGRVEAFEANPSVLADAGPILALNGWPGQIRLHGVCVGEHSRGHADFHIVRGLDSVASTRNHDILRFHQASETIQAPMLALDDFISAGGPIPHLIKLDIEGGEYAAVLGARRLLAGHHPHLVIETHGLEIDGIAGSLALLCSSLEGFGYGLFDLMRGEVTQAAVFARRHRRDTAYLLASQPLMDGDLCARLRRGWRSLLAG
jgi:FkbM family methyltransferase